MKEDVLNGTLLDGRSLLTLAELSRACMLHAETIIELVDEGVLDPCGDERSGWRFPASSLHRVRAIQRLRRDLGINLAGAALVLELREELERLRVRLRILELE